jgi:hypothetical protein
MKLQAETLAILKNFSNINPNLKISPGNILRTISPSKTPYAEAEIPDSFPSDFRIYDLRSFLGIISAFQEPELEFLGDTLEVSEGHSKVRLQSASPEIVGEPKVIKSFPEPDVTFTLTSELFKRVQSISNILQSPDLTMFAADGTMKLIARDKKNSSKDTFEYYLGETDKNFEANFKFEQIKFILDDYEVSISKLKAAQFSAKSRKLVYIVGLEADSKFEF